MLLLQKHQDQTARHGHENLAEASGTEKRFAGAPLTKSSLGQDARHGHENLAEASGTEKRFAGAPLTEVPKSPVLTDWPR